MIFHRLNSFLLVLLTFILTSIVFSQVYTRQPYSSSNPRMKIHSAKQLNSPEYTICIMESTYTVDIANARFPRAKKLFYSGGAATGVMKVLNREADAFLFDSPTLDYVASYNPNVVVLPHSFGEGRLSIATCKQNSALIQDINRFIDMYRANGTYQAMYYRWFFKSGSVIPDIPKPASPTRKVVVGTEGTQVPFNFMGAKGVPMKKGFLTGFDIELVQRMALAYNWEIEWRLYSWEDLLVATQNGQVDFMISELDSAPASRSFLLFSNPYIDSQYVLLVRKDKINSDMLRETEERRRRLSFGVEKGE